MKTNKTQEVAISLRLPDELFDRSKVAADKAGLAHEDLIVRNT